MTRDEVETLILSFPEVERATSYGEASFKVQGKFFTWLRPHLDDSVVVHLASLDERELLIEMDPETFHFTDHYRDYPIVLARLDSVDPGWLKTMLGRRWRHAAPRRLSKLHPAIGAD